MKKGLLILSLIILSLSAQAQWSFTTTSNTYSDLTNPISINNGTVWTSANDFQLTLPFAFNLMGQPYPIITVKAGGGLNFPGSVTRELFVFHTPFGGYWLKDRGTTASLSEIGYVVTGAIGQRIVKVQWKNAGFDQRYPNSSLNDFVNFQIWLFEADNHIEVRFGPHNTSPNTYGNPPGQTSQNNGPSVKLMLNNCNNILGLNGAANQPSYIFYNACNPNYYFVQGSPSSGTTYNFLPTVTGISELSESDFQIFPNPVKQVLRITNVSNNIVLKSIIITDLTGKSIYQEEKPIIDNKNLNIQLNEVKDGIYLIKLETMEGQVIVRKIIKNS